MLLKLTVSLPRPLSFCCTLTGKTYQTALITGASGGIGEAFAEQLAAAGTDLILVARSQDKLEALAAGLRRKHQRRVEVIPLDLSVPKPGQRLLDAVTERGLQADLLVNNAGFGGAGDFHQQSADRDQEMIAVNIATVVDLTHAFLPAMVAAGHGAVINIASMAGFQPMPYMSVYGATKAFVISFTEGLWAEYRGRGIGFLAVCPGPVETGFFDATGNAKLRSSIPSSIVMKPGPVVAGSLKALRAGQPLFIPGVSNRFAAQLPRLMPRRLVAATMAKVMNR